MTDTLPPRTTDLPAQWNPGEVEGGMYQRWVDAGYVTADAESGKPPFCIVIPPPNVTGSLHIGHAFEHTLIDITSRRELGREAFLQRTWGWKAEHGDEGLIYRAERMVNWSPELRSVLSDSEGELVSLRSGDGDGSVVVATTRVETMLGDTAVAVHPDDERYAHLGNPRFVVKAPVDVVEGIRARRAAADIERLAALPSS